MGRGKLNKNTPWTCQLASQPVRRDFYVALNSTRIAQFAVIIELAPIALVRAMCVRVCLSVRDLSRSRTIKINWLLN